MTIRIMARVFVAGELLAEDGPLELDEDALEHSMPEIAARHARLVGPSRPFMVELEFLDEHDPMTRYFRFGTDPAGLLIPVAVAVGGTRGN
jgi:hypothetical protein